MSTILYELPDRYVLDTGEVVSKHVRAVKAILAGKRLDGQRVVDSEDLQAFLVRSHQDVIPWVEGEAEEPHPASFEWNLPEKYLKMNLYDYLVGLMEEYLGQDESRQETHVATAYVERFEEELDLIQKLGMDRFIQSLIYIIDTFRANRVVWGIGRGSSVESLVLFLIGVHRIDPVENQIELNHFFRDK